VNIGIRPTFSSARLTVEAHLLDFSDDLYGQQLTLTLEHRLRGELAFPSVDALAAQIRDDVDRARALARGAEVPA
jgi:riboflavin kinase/FMN adenylyltransferase